MKEAKKLDNERPLHTRRPMNLRRASLDISAEALDQLASQATAVVTDYFARVSELRVFPDTSGGEVNARGSLNMTSAPMR